MENFVIRESSPPKGRPHAGLRWKRSMVEISGWCPRKYRHELSALLHQSYSEIGAFSHSYTIGGQVCLTQLDFTSRNVAVDVEPTSMQRTGISGLEFDSKGIYVASITKAGCLSVHDFESLYCQTKVLPSSLDDGSKELLHLSVSQQLDGVKWNQANEDEVACSSRSSDHILLFDISYISSEPSDVLKKKPTSQGHKKPKGLSDIVFIPSSKSRVVACGLDGVLYAWDRRISNFPCFELSSSCCQSPFNSIQLSKDEQVIFAASENGCICLWDLRGGKTSAAFLSNKEEQSEIFSWGIQSISLDPSCSYQLAFHLDDGWSGVLNLNTLEVTHIHCPPPAWLDGTASNYFSRRKPSYLPALSIYAVPSSCENGIHLLDFYPDASAASHVDFDDNTESGAQSCHVHNTFVSLSGLVTACAAHPLNATILAGTMESSLIMVSQKLGSCD
ncbi:uncharacterized protein LOC116248166 isoform X2 [Nymphaea colorata]|uniref:uncharacterized protein LOC116248166 isoform X2 n=1 Tax=Nymphaea colorata TaxID=210225 RepID=UPI00129DC23B|nr:uncharacterized protein LOC116248166 isoform X2 [Nymphaea colorata]